MTEVRSGTVRANGIAFHYLEVGEGPLVLCLHGLPDNANPHLPPAPSRPGRRRLPGRGAIHAGLRADVPGARWTLPIGAARPGRIRADRRAGISPGVSGRPRLGRYRDLWRRVTGPVARGEDR